MNDAVVVTTKRAEPSSLVTRATWTLLASNGPLSNRVRCWLGIGRSRRPPLFCVGAVGQYIRRVGPLRKWEGVGKRIDSAGQHRVGAIGPAPGDFVDPAATQSSIAGLRWHPALQETQHQDAQYLVALSQRCLSLRLRGAVMAQQRQGASYLI